MTPIPAARPADPFKGATVWTIDPVLKKIGDALLALGATSSAVARRLALMRCKGERGNPQCCPVLNYLRRQPVGNFALRIAGTRLEVRAMDGWVEEVSMPPAVEFFVRRFDRGEFPALASESSGPGDGFPRTDWVAVNDGGAAPPAGAAVAA